MMKALIALWLLVIAFAAPAMAGDRMLSAKSTPVINAITGQRLTLGQRIGAVAMLGLDVIDPFIVAKGASKAFTASGQVLQSFTRGLADNLAPGRIRNVIQQTAADHHGCRRKNHDLRVRRAQPAKEGDLPSWRRHSDRR